MPSFNRRTATKVKNGRVLKKNRHLPTGQAGHVLDRRPPGRGCRHVVSKRDIQNFIEIIPDWHLLSANLERIGLGRHAVNSAGVCIHYHREETCAIWLNAWPDDLWIHVTSRYFETHKQLLERLRVAYEPGEENVLCRFTEAQAKAFVLLHVFMHELGHHHDNLHQRHRGSTKGEDYAESFANSRFERLYPEYVRVFGTPG